MLLRRLIHATGLDLRRVDLPGHDDAWRRWADASEPSLPRELFAPSLPAAIRTLQDRLDGTHERPIRVSADSADEALAFLACVLDASELRRWGDRAVIVTIVDALRWLDKQAPDALAIIASAAAARELGCLGQRHALLVLASSHAGPGEVQLAPQPLDRQSFARALAAIEITGERAERLARESARSPTILRRRLAKDPLITTPHWASDHPTRRSEALRRLARTAPAIAWPCHDETTLGDLVERVNALPPADRDVVWRAIDAWADTADDAAKAMLRDRIQSVALSWRSRFHKLDPSIATAARAAHARLQPADPVLRHRWLFAEAAIDVPADAVPDTDELDIRTRLEAIRRLRREAIAEVWRGRGVAGVEALPGSGNAASDIGWTLGQVVTNARERVDLARTLLGSSMAGRAAETALRGLLAGLPEPEREDLLDRLTATLDAGDTIRLLVAAPFRAPIWHRGALHDPAIAQRYWRAAVPDCGPDTPDERATLIDRLLEAGRPNAGFAAVQPDLNELDSEALRRLLDGIATTAAEPGPVVHVAGYDIGKALRILAARPDVAADQLARLERAFIGALDHSKHGILNLERAVTDEPLAFVHVLALAYPRDDDGENPPGWRLDDPALGEAAARRAWKLLNRLRRMPGTRTDGTIDTALLSDWINEVRRLCRAHGRAAIGDHSVGELLARAPADPDGTWPCRAVAQALDAVGTDELRRGFHRGVDNARGEVVRGENGAQERALADRYRVCADAHRDAFPFTARLLDDLAETDAREAVFWDHAGTARRRPWLCWKRSDT